MNFETIYPPLKPSQIAVDKSSVQVFLKEKGYKSQTTSDGREYWSRNGGTLLTLEAAFDQALKSSLPQTRQEHPSIHP